MSTSPRARIVTVANQKGGVGKTTSTMNLGVALARQDKRVLLIDSDPQANLTSYLGITPGEPPHENLRTLDEVYLAKRPWDSLLRTSVITPTRAGVHLLAADKNLAGVEYYLLNRSDRENVLSRFLEQVSPSYDYIFIDTPPSVSLLTLNALVASTHVLIPVQAEFFGLEGIVKLRETIRDVQARWNPKLRLIGVLPTQINERRKLTTEVLNALGSELGPGLFRARIHESASVAESSGHAKAVLDYSRRSTAAQDYLAAASELQQRLLEEPPHEEA